MVDSLLFTVDIGNTRVKACLWDSPTALEPLSEFTDSSDDCGDAINWFKDLSLCKGVAAVWYISSVNKRKSFALVCGIARERPKDVVKEIALQDVPLNVRYDHPEKLGLDRAVAAFAGIRLLGDKRPFLVVDAGTAVTIDYVDSDGIYCGGAILPGSRLIAEALRTKTSCLPMLSDPENEELVKNSQEFIFDVLSYPATETLRAIRLGVVFSVVGAIGAFYWNTLRSLRNKGDFSDLVLLLAGGDSLLTKLSLQRYFDDLESALRHKFVRPEIVLEPRLVSYGLRELANSTEK